MIPSFYPENIPQEMKDIPHWVLCKLEEVDGKIKKIPYQPNGKKANVTRKDTWCSFEETLAAYDPSVYICLGFVFTKDLCFVATDFDHVRHDSYSRFDGCIFKEWDEGIFAEIQDFKSYAEISLSEEGAHVICKGRMKVDGKKKNNREMYCHNRFFAITGNHIEGTPKTINEAQECINDYFECWFEDYETTNNETYTDSRSPEMSDEEVLQHCRTAANSEKFNRLYSGEITEYHSSSEAEFAFCRILAFYTQKKEQIDRIFRISGLYNKKWNRRGKYALEKAVKNLPVVFTGESKTVSFTTNVEAQNELKEMTPNEIELLKKGFASRHLTLNLPDDHLITQMVKYLDRMTDGYSEFKILGSFFVLSACTQRKPIIDLSTTVNGVFTNIWAQFLGISTISRKTTIQEFLTELLSYAMHKQLVDIDPSMEAYLEGLSHSPIQPMIYDESSVLFQKMGQKYNSGYFEFECKIYDCKSHEKRLASGGKKEPRTFPVIDPFVTKLYGTTFVKYKRSMTIPDFDSGYGYRFLYAAPTYDFEERPPHIRTAEDIGAKSECEARLAKLYYFFSHETVFSMTVDADAMEYYNKICFETSKQIKNMPNQDLLGSAWGRYQIYIIKLAALIELGKARISKNICLESVKIATSMVLDYFLPTLCDVYNLLTVDPKNNKIDKIIEALKEFKGVANHTDLLRKVRLESKEFQSLILTMIESKQIEMISEKNPKNNKITQHYHLFDCDAINFKNAESTYKNFSNSQTPQTPKLTYTQNSNVSLVSLTNFTESQKIDNNRTDLQNNDFIKSQIQKHDQSQGNETELYKNIQTHANSRIENIDCEFGSLVSSGIWESENSQTVFIKYSTELEKFLRNCYQDKEINVLEVSFDFCQTPIGKKAFLEIGLNKIKEYIENYIQNSKTCIVSVEEAVRILDEEGI